MVPLAPLSQNVNYYYRITTALKDTTGLSPTGAFTISFHTGTVTDTTQPRVLTVTPPDLSVGVGVNAPIRLRFSEPLNTLALSVGPTGSIQLTSGGNPIAPASISLNSSQDVTITPYQSFPDNAVITVSVTADLDDPSGNKLIPFTSSFTTRTGPAIGYSNVTAVSPADGTQNVPLNTYVQLTTDTAMDPTTATALTLYDETAGGGAIPGVWSTSTDGKVITFVPSATLAASHNFRYYWTDSFRDINGNQLISGNSFFRTAVAASSAPPAVVATNPPNGRTGVPHQPEGANSV